MPAADWQLHCPIPIESSAELVTLGHGEGARLTRRLIGEWIVPRFTNRELAALGDAAHVEIAGDRLAITTDSFVVSPLFFPGGDIGSLAIHGTVNDLAVSGSVPEYVSLALIIEEGLPLAVLDCVLDSAARAAAACGVRVVTGDTKVVPRGAAGGLFVNTTGIGRLVPPVPPGPGAIREGDVLIISGPIGRHGIAVMAAREELAFEPQPTSDSAPVTPLVAALREEVSEGIRALRDATRGGLAAVLHEWAVASGLTLHVSESRIPVTEDVRGVCELLGLDPLFVANEGTIVIAAAPEAAARCVSVLRSLEISAAAAEIGVVRGRGPAPVTIQRGIGNALPLDEPAGALLPRIC
jgi:hydrogenase expression/formation protein HypE